MAKLAKSAQDVYYYFDEQGRACVDLYAKALDILDHDNPDCWKYEIVTRTQRTRLPCLLDLDRHFDGLVPSLGPLPTWVGIQPNKDNVLVHHAKLLGVTGLEVKAQHSPVCNLTPMIRYNVYFDMKLMHGAKGFSHTIMFEFTDQNGSPNRFPLKLTPGDMTVLVGQFISTAGSHNVKAKMYDFNCQEKSGLLIRCVTITPEE